ncbi:P1 family peptidase [Microvirga flavescens]|uniref:DmpA family aminopeptidase n=1 Tax=Microvirga flavescens TaxID=2249811 RepID=UPI000DDC0983|nr:P1 family peptidase [Microvirga flavescens]
MTKLARDFGLRFGEIPTGAHNAITDVPGIRVGHATIAEGELQTGVTAILPHAGNLYREKVRAAVEVINGFGKSAGLIQVEELGSLETPILLTNTFGVGACTSALIRRAIAQNADIGRTTATVNPVVCECNDGWLNDIQAMAVTEGTAFAALDAAVEGAVAQGAVGAGRGMSCFGFKGGIGTSSRRLSLDGVDHHLGVLVLANFGRAGDLILPDGRRPLPEAQAQAERGSIIAILATDIPLECRQLRRVSRRCGAGFARLGAFWGHGSGDIALGFSTASRIHHDERRDLIDMRALNEDRIDDLFRAATDATQEAVLNAMCCAPGLLGYQAHCRPSLGDWLARG